MTIKDKIFQHENGAQQNVMKKGGVEKGILVLDQGLVMIK